MEREVGRRRGPALAAVAVSGTLVLSTLGIAIAQGGDPAQPVAGPVGLPVASDSARQALASNDLLLNAPWLSQPNGSPSLDDVETFPSLVFPAGTSYDEAITALYISVKKHGSLPDGAELGPPLPRSVVYAAKADGLALSLTAPYGYDVPTGNILSPSLQFDEGITMEQAQAATSTAAREGQIIPEGAKVVGNLLEPCQVMIDDREPPTCPG